MNFDVRFIHGRQTIELKNIHLTVGAAVRVPIERHQRFYEIVLWRTNPSLLTVAMVGCKPNSIDSKVSTQ